MLMNIDPGKVLEAQSMDGSNDVPEGHDEVKFKFSDSDEE